MSGLPGARGLPAAGTGGAPPLSGAGQRRLRAVLIVLAAALLLEVLAEWIQLPAAAVLLLLTVASAAYTSGLLAALLGASLSIGYIYYRALTEQTSHGWFTTPHGEALLIGVVMVTAPALIGSLRTRLNAVLARERALRGIAVEGEQRLISVLENMVEGFVTIDGDWRVAYVNPRGAKLLGRSPGELLGRNIWDVYPEAGQAGAFEQMRHAMAERTAVEFEEEYPPAGRSFEVRAYPAGEGMSIYFRDVTERAAARRFAVVSQQLLADTGVTLSESLDVDRTLNGFARLLVPALGDCCIITEREESGALRQLPPVLRTDAAPERRAALERLLSERPLEAEEAVAGGTAAVVVDEARGRRLPGADGLRALLAATRMHAALIAPLCAQGRTMGTLTLLSDQRGRYGKPECGLAEELGRRAALALDNIRLYDTALLANRAKSDFLAIMSHELRTPLTTVMGYTDLLLSGVPEPLPPVSHRYVERVRMAAWHLLAIIEQILVYTRLNVGTEEVQQEWVSAADVLHDAAALIEPVARDRGVAFSVQPVMEPIEFVTDVTKLRQILLNLLSNAVRFTDEGTVSIEAARDGAVVRFVVRDTGIGIAPEHIERVFDAFWQVDPADTRRSGGTGLGLSVARRLARLLGGDVTAASQAGAGTAFTVTMPLDAPVLSRGGRSAGREAAEGKAN